MMALDTEIMTALVIGIGIDSGIGVTADTIGPADFGLLTDVRTVGPFKTASVSRIEATEPLSLPSANRRLATMARRLNVPIDTSENPGRRQAGRGFLLFSRKHENSGAGE